MRISLFFTLCCVLNVSAGLNVNSQTFDISSKDVSVKEIFRIIESKSEYRFFYNDELSEVNRLVSINVTASNVTNILAQLFDQSKVSYKVMDNNLIVIAPKQALQQLKVSGMVTDANNQPLPGVSILVQGTVKGTITDKDGRYAIEVPDANAVLVFSFLGYLPEEKIVGAQTNINIMMVEDVKQLEEVVVVGYGKTKKVNLTGSVASVGGKELAAYPVSNAAQTLQGKVAGVTITSVDGRPDATVAIRVRGGGSITQSNDPLFIVDGFPVNSMNDIPASQIESVSILKDASSTAIYGARGANGVVLITTKTAKVGKISVSYDGNYQIKKPSKYLGVLDPYDYTLLNWQYGTLFGAGYGDAWAMAFGLGATYGNHLNDYKTAKTRDIQKEVLKTAHAQTHNISINGGTEKTKYSLSLDYVDDDGLKIQSWYKRANVLAKLQQELAKKLILDVDIRLASTTVFDNEDVSSSTGSKLTEAMRFCPVTPLGDISSANTQLSNYEAYVRPAYDPIGYINDVYDQTKNQSVRGNVALSWTIIDGLTARSEYNMSRGYSSEHYYIGSFAKNTVGVEGGNARIDMGNSSSFRLVNTLNYAIKGQNKSHNIDVLIGEELNGNNSEASRMTGTRYPLSYDATKVFANMNQYTNQNEVVILNSEGDPYRLSSFFGRLNYSFKDRYLFTATLRADGSSRFATNKQWGYFPAAAFAWRASQEPFMKDLPFVDNLKLRLSYGQAGNDRIDAGLWKPLWRTNSAGYAYNDVGNSYYTPAAFPTLVNKDLKWETTITRNVGIDLGLFKSRIYGTIDGYWNTTKDLLMYSPLAPITGYTAQMQNVGQTRNLGIEILVGSDIVQTKDLKVSASMNIAFNRNKVEKLANDMPYYNYTTSSTYGWASNSTKPLYDYTLIVGQSVGLIRGYKYDGFYTTADFNYDAATKVYTLKDGVPNSRTELINVPGLATCYPGMLKLKKMGTATSATLINETDDAVVIGNTNPKHTGGFNLNATYKSFDFLMAFNWSYKNDIYNANKLANSSGLKTPFRNFSDAVAGWYQIFNVDATGNLVRVYDPAELDALNVNAKTAMPFQEAGIVHSGGIEDGTFLRLNNVTLGYTLPSKLTKKIAIQKFRIYTTISNAWLWTKYTGYDPEVDARRGSNTLYPTPGQDFGAYPKARTFTFGVNVIF